MRCIKCGKKNNDNDLFCSVCGAPLKAGGAGDGSPRFADADFATINATTMLAAKEARKADIAGMRPLTRAAYNISESDQSATLSMLLSILNVVLSLGLVAVIIKIFDTISLLSQSMTSNNISGSLSNLFYGSATASNTQSLIWLVVLFFVLMFGFMICGRLNIRVRKVNRKRKREQMDSRL